jgi:CRISPR-associated protein Csm3
MSIDKLTKKIIVTGKIIAQTGLQIGGTNSAMSIGGPDKTVIRNPITNEPYIPGSSLKGKMRSLIEISYGYIREVNMGNVHYGPDDNFEHISAKLFGSTNKDTEKQRPSRIIVRDGKLLNPEKLQNTELPFTESKTEVIIDRITSAAMPRQFERVPAGAEFDLNIVLNIFEKDNEKELIEHVFKGLQLVQDDYLGGSGSRGSGQVKFKVEKVIQRTAEFYHGKNNEEDITEKCNLPKDLK